MFFRRILSVFFIAFTISQFFYGQVSYIDTLRISLQKADSLFLANNLILIAEQYNVEASKALVLQSRLWDNPNVVVNQNLINTEYRTNGGRKWLDWTDKGETNAQIQQLFLLAGKRNKRVSMAELTAAREEENYFDLLRTLKYSLRSGFYNLYYTQATIRIYDQEIKTLSKIIQAYESQLENGFASKKDVLRLKATLFSLENEKNGFTTQLINNLADFNVLMHTTGIYYAPMPDTALLSHISTDSLNLRRIIDTALVNRYDLKMAKADLNIDQFNLNYQKALAVPDLTVIGGWDRNGSYIHDYNYLGLQVDLPFFNRNQGNIRSARYNVESSRMKLQNTEDQVREDVIQAYSILMQNQRLYTQFDKKLSENLESLNQEVIKNYEKRNISLLEFLDFFDAYKEDMIQLNTLLNNRANSIENLNFSVGKEVIRLL
ncbi:MAG: TolC family protein [Bacteroidales bacterium]|jgi:cobalt-zinc-cadmium efflux system outer membrane protein